MIGCSCKRAKEHPYETLQNTTHNIGILCCRVTAVYLYFISLVKGFFRNYAEIVLQDVFLQCSTGQSLSHSLHVAVSVRCVYQQVDAESVSREPCGLSGSDG